MNVMWTFLFALATAVVQCTTLPAAPSGSNDHLIKVLLAMHHSDTFRHLPPSEKIILTELLAAAEVDQITHYINITTFPRILTFLDHVNRINQTEAHLLERYLVQEIGQEEIGHRRRSLQSVVHTITTNPAYQSLSASDQSLVMDLLNASHNHTVTDFIHKEGYSRIISLVEHITSPAETHVFLQYLVNHMVAEGHHHGHNPGVIG